MSRRRTWILGGSVLIAAALVVGLLGVPDRPADPRTSDEGATAAAPEAPAVLLAGRGDVTTSVLRSEPPSAMPLPDALAECRIRGRVVGPRAFPEDSLVFVVARVGRRDEYVARARPDAEGRFEVVLAARAGEPGWSVPITAAIPGHAWAQAFAEPVPGSVVDVEIPVATGTLLHGRVVDLDARPVVGLRIGFVNGGSNVFQSTSESLPDPRIDEAPGSWHSFLLATCTTGPEGEFEVHGLEGVVSPGSYDDAWWLEGPLHGAIEVGEAEVEIVARPAFRLQVEASPADPTDDPERWKPLAVSFRIAEPRDGSSWMAGPRLAWKVRGPVPDFGMEGFTGFLTVDTVDHLQESRRIEFLPGAWSKEERILLRRRPPEGYGTVIIRLGIADASRGAIRVVHHREIRPRHWSGNWLTVETRPDGTLDLRVPPGRARFEVPVAVPLGGLFTGSNVVDVEAGRETRVDIPAEPFGSARVMFAPDVAEQEVHLTLSRGEPRVSATWKGSAPRDGLALPAIPEGTWDVTWKRTGGSPRSSQLVVVAGEETVLDLSP